MVSQSSTPTRRGHHRSTMDPRRGRHHRLLPAAVLLALQQKSTSLMLPRQIPALQYSRKWRRIRTAGPLQGIHAGTGDPLSPPPSRTYLVHNQLLKGASGRKQTSLLMAKNSEPTGGFGKGDDKKKRKGNGNSKGGPGRKNSNRDSFGKLSGGGSKGSASPASSSKGNRSKARQQHGQERQRQRRTQVAQSWRRASTRRLHWVADHTSHGRPARAPAGLSG